MSIKRKILLFSTIFLVVILLFINGSIFVLFKNMIYDNDVERLQAEAQTTVEAMNQAIAQNRDVDLSPILRAYLPQDGMIRIITKDTTSLLSIARDVSMQELPTAYQTNQFETIRTFQNVPYAVVSFPIIWTDGSIVMFEMTERLQMSKATIDTLLIVLLVATLIVLIPATILGNVLSKVIMTPIQTLTSTMKEIQSTGDYKKIELEKRSKDELYEMGMTFNAMIDILEENYEKQERFVSDASHELKTPLTVIESYARMLKRWGMKREDILEESVEAIYQEAVRMKAMTEQLLQLAHENTKVMMNREDVDLLEVVQETGKNMYISYKREFEIVTEGSSFFIWADKNLIKQLIYILLDNARKYSEHAITMTVVEREESCSVIVCDKGIGVSKEDIDKIFDRFYRVDKARARESGGSGLGLSIAKKIVDAHGGTIEMDSEVGKGTSVTVTLPKRREMT